ncbi:UDP-2,3-diacylglucosamine diphosphatase LpxI [Desulfobacterales bacterium HSG16]|nr:UDP-2,3-diacylglucosamine diphosphatase LpxI [Desulfobacterales bacterium HSG16]
MKRIGIIAGNGQFPLIFSKKAKSKGYGVYAAAYVKEADPALKKHVEVMEWLHLGQLKKLVRFFHKNDVKEAVMMGGITKTRMFTNVRPDIAAISLFARMKSTHDDGILRAFADYLEKEGIKIISATFLLPELLADPGCWTKRKPAKNETADIDMGWDLAKEIGKLDIGQSIVVAGGSVMAVEAIDGTDATILRGGLLSEGQAVVVKICKPNQDIRFDMPSVGLGTIETMQKAGAKVLALEAGRTIVFDKESMIALADSSRISIVGIEK